MKRSTLFGMMIAALAAPSFAQELPASTSTEVYDLTPWNNDAMIKLFAKVSEEGRNFPTKAEFEALGLTFDLEFARSHTRRRAINEDASKNVVPEVFATRRLWCNFPGGFGKGTGGYPSTRFHNDVFSMWNYTNVFGSWNCGFLQAPGSWMDAAHRNGSRIYSGIKFYESWSNSAEAQAFYNFLVTKNADGTYKYTDALVRAAAFFGSDGFNYNDEAGLYTKTEWTRLHQSLYKRAKELGLNDFGVGNYTNISGLSDSNVGQLLGDAENGQAFDCFLNYSGGDLAYRGVPTSLAAAKKAMGTAENVYQGVWIVGLDRSWAEMTADNRKEMNICLWGEHDQSRFWQYAVGLDNMDTQANYQLLLEKGFSGGNRNPLNRPALVNSGNNFQVSDASKVDEQLKTFGGFASLIPERTAITGNLPFQTYFSLGNGESYFYKGKATHGAWYNMSQQDIVPTYRWLVTAKDNMTTAANDIDVRFTHEDAYIGGSCIRLTGSTTNGNDIVIYRSSLKANGPVKATVALKNGLEGKNSSNLSLIVKKQGATSFIEVPCGELEGAEWQVKELPVGGLNSGDVIEYIGLRVNNAKDYKMMVGQLKLEDGARVQQAGIKEGSLLVEVKEETVRSLSLKLNWEPDFAAFNTSYEQFGNVFNDEINVDHYEILYKDSENGKVKEIGRTSQWATYIGNLPLEQTAQAYIGVRTVSTDLYTTSKTEWVAIPRYTGELPAIEEEDPYGKTYLHNLGSSTRESILSTIYWEKITTEGATVNIDYQKSSNPANNDNYYYAEECPLKVEQGQKITINLKAREAGSDCLKYDFVYLYMDYDGNYSFLDDDETLGYVGTLNASTPAIANPGVSFEFTVPEDAKTGATRLRIVGSDAWGAHPGPTGGTWKGHSLDFPVEITGNNPERGGALTYKDLQDKGEIEEPEQLEGTVAIDAIEANAMPAVEIAGDMAYFTNVEKAWFYDINGRLVKFVGNASEAANVSELANGVYVVKVQNAQIIRSLKVVK